MARAAETSMRSVRALRPAASALALALACLLLPLALTGQWVRGTVGQTDRYVDTVAPLAQDQTIRDAIVTRLTTELMTALDEQGLVREAVAALVDTGVPPRAADALGLLAAPLRDRLETVVERVVRRVVDSDEFSAAWRSANESAHEQLVSLVRGENPLVDQDGTVRLDLATIINTVRLQLVDAGLPAAARIPEVEASFPLATVGQVVSVREGYDLLDTWTRRITWAVPVLVAIGIGLAGWRRRAVLVTSVGAIGLLLLVLLGLGVARGALLDGLPDSSSPAAAGAAYDIVSDRLRHSVRYVVAGLALVAALTALTGPGDRATGFRRGCRDVGHRAAAASRTWPGTPWVAWGVAAVATALLLFVASGPVVAVTLIAIACLGALVGVRAGQVG